MQENNPVKYQFVSKITNELIDLEKPLIVLVKAVAPDDEFILSTENTALAVEVNYKDGIFTPVDDTFQMSLKHRRIPEKESFNKLIKKSLENGMVQVGGKFFTHLFFQVENKQTLDELVKKSKGNESINQFSQVFWGSFKQNEKLIDDIFNGICNVPSLENMLKNLEKTGNVTQQKIEDTTNFCDYFVKNAVENAIYPEIRTFGWYVNSDSTLLSPYTKVVQILKDSVMENIKVSDSGDYLPKELQDKKSICESFFNKITNNDSLNYGAFFYQESIFNKKVAFHSTRAFETPVQEKKKTIKP